jgi:NADH:quinone reductase (non-electrogenic)
MFSNNFTRAFGIDHPIVCGGMLGAGRAELIAAVANAGGLGFLSGLTHPTPQRLLEEIQRCRELTDRPFGVNITMLPTLAPVPYDEYVEAVVSARVPFVETAGRSPEPFMATLKAAGIKVIHKATSIRHAVTAERIGVDAVSVDGFECAGHPGEEDIGGLVLIPAATARISVPVLASGGIADARGLVAALALGAQGVNMGTRFLATREAPVHDNVKRQIVDNSETSTNLVFRKFRNSARVAKNAVSDEILEIEQQQEAEFSDIAHLASGTRGRQEVLAEGNMDDGLWWAGQSQGLIHDVPSVNDLLSDIVAEAEHLITNSLPLNLKYDQLIGQRK